MVRSRLRQHQDRQGRVGVLPRIILRLSYNDGNTNIGHDSCPTWIVSGAPLIGYTISHFLCGHLFLFIGLIYFRLFQTVKCIGISFFAWTVSSSNMVSNASMERGKSSLLPSFVSFQKLSCISPYSRVYGRNGNMQDQIL